MFSFSLVKILLAFVLWNVPPPTTQQEIEITIVAGSNEDFETTARFEALGFVEPQMTIKRLELRQTEIACLKKQSGEYVFGCGAPKAYHRRVVDLAEEIVEIALREYREKGRDAYLAYIMREMRLANEAMCESDMCGQAQARKAEVLKE
jgi:hypothetical protein